jgi:hypothetical protein
VTAALPRVMSTAGRCRSAQRSNASTAAPAKTVAPFHSPCARSRLAELISRRMLSRSATSAMKASGMVPGGCLVRALGEAVADYCYWSARLEPTKRPKDIFFGDSRSVVWPPRCSPCADRYRWTCPVTVTRAAAGHQAQARGTGSSPSGPPLETVRTLVETGALTGERGAYRPTRRIQAIEPRADQVIE